MVMTRLPSTMNLVAECTSHTEVTKCTIYTHVVLPDGRVVRTFVERPRRLYYNLCAGDGGGVWTMRIYKDGRLEPGGQLRAASLADAERMICALIEAC